MALLKPWCLPPLAALLLLSIVPTVAEVVRSISACDGFLLQQTPPNVPGILERGNILNQNRYKPICQTFRDMRSFVTLYDVENKIPVFSAYKYAGKSNIPRPKTQPWMIEPQLENVSNNRNMKPDNKQTIYHFQAGDTDYRNNMDIDRGHLFPCSYGFTENAMRSTFTLTNIVPQAGTFNRGSWRRMESCIRCVLDKYCIDNNGRVEGFVVAGAQPSTDNILNNKINIPSALWSAFCCNSREKGWLASAHWGKNVPDTKSHLQTKTLAELRTLIPGFDAFPGTQCPLHTTVAQFYPELDRTCECPPHISEEVNEEEESELEINESSPEGDVVPPLPIPATTSSPFLPSNSSILCPQLIQTSILHHYQNVLAYYQSSHQYQNNN